QPAQPQPSGNAGDMPEALIPAEPDLEYLRSIAAGDNLPAMLRGNILAAVRRIEAAQPSGQAQQDAIDETFEAVRRRLCHLPRYSFLLGPGGGVRRVKETSGNWIEFDAAHALFDPIAVDSAR